MNPSKAIVVLLHRLVQLHSDSHRHSDDRERCTRNALDARLIEDALRDLGYTGLSAR